MENVKTETLIQMRKDRTDRMEKLQIAGRWTIASNYHETFIAPINVELSNRKVW
jgi:hypothetical protein